MTLLKDTVKNIGRNVGKNIGMNIGMNIGINVGSKSAALTMNLLLVCYRSVLAPALLFFTTTPSCCRFLPTCSDYAQEAVRQHGWKGFVLTTGRLLRCRPLLFSSPRERGIRLDPVSPCLKQGRPQIPLSE